MTKDELLDLIEPLWPDYSAAEIALKIQHVSPGTTRNKIIGLANRNRDRFPPKKNTRNKKLKVPQHTIKSKSRSHPLSAVSKHFGKLAVSDSTFITHHIHKPQPQKHFKRPIEAFKPDTDATYKSLMELQNNDCRWPFDGETVMFCGQKVKNRHSNYCQLHQVIHKRE